MVGFAAPLSAAEQQPTAPRAVRICPWASLGLVVVALAVEGFSGGHLLFDRTRIAAGEWWRLGTGQFAHLGSSHLAWNLAVIIPAGIWSETVAPRRTRWFLLLAPWWIGITLYLGDRRLEQYAGLSGVAVGLLILLALAQLAGPSRRDGWFWWSVMALVGVKLFAESFAGEAIFARFSTTGVQPVPLSHLAGMVAAVGVHGAGRLGQRKHVSG